MTQRSIDSVYPVTLNNLLLYRVRAFDAYPDLTHAIFTRRGGISQAPYHSLNLGSTIGDDADAVRKNFQLVCRAVNIVPQQTVSSYLVHGTDILTINKHNRQQYMGQADGLITGDLDIYLFMRFADCTPLIFYDPIQKVIGLTHAGWRGTLQNAAGATVAAMVNRLGCQAKNIIAVIGPAIGPCCYEVGPEVIAAAGRRLTDSAALFTNPNGKPDHAHFDMWAANRQQLVASGIEQVIQSDICTACHTDKFFSHRAEKGRTGRFGVIMGLRGEDA
jgi:YfiH family protein